MNFGSLFQICGSCGVWRGECPDVGSLAILADAGAELPIMRIDARESGGIIPSCFGIGAVFGACALSEISDSVCPAAPIAMVEFGRVDPEFMLPYQPMGGEASSLPEYFDVSAQCRAGMSSILSGKLGVSCEVKSALLPASDWDRFPDKDSSGFVQIEGGADGVGGWEFNRFHDSPAWGTTVKC